MERLTLKQLAKESGRAYATLIRYARRGELPTIPEPTPGWSEDDRLREPVYPREASLEFVATIRKNVRRAGSGSKAQDPLDKKVERVKDRALESAHLAAVAHVRGSIAEASANHEWLYEARLHRELAEMLENLVDVTTSRAVTAGEAIQ